jgi:predicted small lipoprotein YifL
MRRPALVALVALVALAGLAGCGRGGPAPVAPAEPAPAPATPGSAAAATAAEGAANAEAAALPEPNRPLTAGERAMLRPIFRDGVDYDKVRVIDAPFPFQPAGTYMTPRGHIYAPGRLFREDFSLPSLHGVERAVFVHEIGHVWQFANGIDLVARAVAEYAKYRGDYEKAYPYRLEPGRDLADYGMEQQASILEDYYLVTAVHDGPYRMENRGLSERARAELFAGVLRKFLADARYARGMDAGELADRHARAADRAPPGPAAPEESRGATHMCGWRFAPPKR